MPAMKVNELAKDDLFWQIEYRHDRCTLCGKCVASCPLKQIETKSGKRRKVVSEDLTPNPKIYFQAVPVIKQVVDIYNFCRAAEYAKRYDPNDAIKPVRNQDSRFPAKYRAMVADPFKRGGRTNLEIEPRTLDRIRIGRISQMTDPSLDAQRHTFDLLTPFGRVLPPEEVPFKVNASGQLELDGDLPPVRWIYPIIIGDMSIGALSWRVWEAIAIATAYLNEEVGLPIRMCSGEGGVPVKLLKSRYLKYMILQIASGHFGWNRIINTMPHMTEDPAGILIKIGQGAKPGDGGLLMAKKVAKHIQEIRGVPKTDLLSPPNHQGLYSIEESVQKMFLSMSAAFKFKVPVAIKVAASGTSVSVYNNLLRDPYNVVRRLFSGWN